MRLIFKTWCSVISLFVVALLFAFWLVGCGAPQIVIPAGQAAVFYAQARADYATAKILIVQACSGPAIAPQGPVTTKYLDKDSCNALAAIDLQAQTLRKTVEQALLNTAAPVDWGQVMSYTASVTEMLIKLGVFAIK